ncbi:pyrophosphatase PpaX [Clostridium sardiniense]|uniref:pyrophosphatase PpaX n=1 Tax=Clostridium sardiniense TaxID=29369 RepID=UPI00195802D5|nr:pyrophosphatase PpaX [Clostridium sardiniense]
MIKAVLFDLDGTLLNTNELIYKSFKHTFKEGLGLTPSKSEITSHYGQPLPYTFKMYTENEDKIQSLINRYRKYNEEFHDNMCFTFKGVDTLLEELKNRGIKMGVVTSKRGEMARRGMEIANITKYMDIIVTPECTEKHKPSGEPAIYACNHLGVKPEETIMVGDSHFDLLCGIEAGCKTCGVRYTELDIKRLEELKPDYFIDSPEEILELL